MSELRDTLASAGVPFKERGTNVGRGFVNIHCPFCGEQRFHCGINEDELWFKCFVCGEGGAWYKIRSRLVTTYPGAGFETLHRGDPHHFIDAEGLTREYETKISRKFGDSEHDARVRHWMTAVPHPDELKSPYRCRGVSGDTLEQVGVEIGIRQIEGYVAFPQGDNVVARKYMPEFIGPRWWKRVNTTPFLFGEQLAVDRACDVGVVAEGVFDVLRLPLGYCVGILGSAVSDVLAGHIAVVFSHASRVVLALDRDANNSSLATFALTLTDIGFDVQHVDWSTVPDPQVKDIDEVLLQYGQGFLYQLLGIDVPGDEVLL